MKKGAVSLPTLLLIGWFSIFLASCSGSQRRFVAADATMIHKGDSQQEVVELLGQPDAMRKTSAGTEWYYYEKHRPFYGKIPLLNRYVGKEKVEALMVLISDGRVADVLYYVPKK